MDDAKTGPLGGDGNGVKGANAAIGSIAVDDGKCPPAAVANFTPRIWTEKNPLSACRVQRASFCTCYPATSSARTG